MRMKQRVLNASAAWPWSIAAVAAVSVAGGSGAFGQCCKAKAACETAITETVFDLSAQQVHEAQANTFEHSLQNRACLDVDPDGNILVVWDSRRQELNSYAVVGQRFDPLGRRLGTEFRINDYAPGAQHEAAVVYDQTGRAWVAWESSHQDGDGSGVYLRRFGDHEGEFLALSGEQQVNETTKGIQFDPSIASNNKGQVLVTWNDGSDDSTIRTMGRLFGTDGQPISGEFAINASENGRDRLSTAVGLDDGRFLVSWDRVDANGDPSGIFVTVVNSDGRTGKAHQINTDDGRFHIEPSIASVNDGEFIATWMRTTEDGNGYDVIAQRLDSDLAPAGDVFVVSAWSGDWQSGTGVATADDGRFVVSYSVWGEKPISLDKHRPQTPSTLMARVYDASGEPAGEAFRVNQNDGGKHELAASSNSQRVVWSDLDQLAFAWNGKIGEDAKGIGLTVLAPEGLNFPAPPEVEWIAAGSDLTAADVRVPPIPTENWEPQERELNPADAGPDYGFQAYTTTEWQPPDPDLAVGPDHIVGVVNMRVAVYDKAGNELFHEYLEDFWGDLGANYFVFDPVAQYDHLADRFVVVSAEHRGGDSYNCYLDVAVSKTSNPMDGWHKYSFSVSGIGYFLDFENLGIGEDAYFVTADYFGGQGNFIHIFEKAPMLNGNSVTMDHVRTTTSLISLGSTDIMTPGAPAQYFGTTYSGSSTRVKLYALEDPLGAKTLSSYNLTVSYFTNPPDAQQLGSSNRLSTIDFRIKHGVYRDGHLYLGHATGENSTARVRWYDIDLNGWPNGGNPSLAQEGTINLGSGQHSWFQDLGVDDEGDIAIAVNRSSSSDYPFVSRLIHKAGDASGTVRAESRLVESNGAHTGGRWGDYAGVDEDPVDPGVFWSHHEYNEGTGTNWRTWIGRFDTDQSMVLDVSTLTRGQPATITTYGAAANGTVYVIYSFAGTGSTYVPALDVTLGLANPKLGGSSTANSSGTATFNTTVPSGAPAGTVWLQSAEMDNTSDVVETVIN